MAIEGASAGRGRAPDWLRRAADVRLLDYAADKDDTLLVLGVPALGEAAEDLYRQKELWDTRPSEKETAVDVFARVVAEVGGEQEESEWFDTGLLKRLSALKPVFGDQLLSLTLPGGRTRTVPRGRTVLDTAVTATATSLSSRTPPERQARVVGVLDMIRYSTRSFSLKMDDGAELRGVLKDPKDAPELAAYFGQRVLVHGRVVYRPSGRALRMDATAIRSGENQPALFARIPRPMVHRNYRQIIAESGKRKKGVAAFFGIWPGDESAEDFERMLREVRGKA